MSKPHDPRARWYDPILRHPVAKTVAGGIAAAGLATTLMAASPAEAQDVTPYGAGGVFLGYQWGEGAGFLWGIEGRGGVDMRREFDGPGFATTATARFSFVNLDPQIHIGGQAGVSFGMFALMGDLSVGYRWGTNEGVSLPIGFEMQAHFATSFLRLDPVRWTGAVGGGAFVLPREGGVQVAVAGRALHTEEGHAELPTYLPMSERRRPTDVDPDVADALAAEWSYRAQTEWASVPAFLQLAQQLQVAGAPRALVTRALEAADDEIRHAVGASRAAMVYSGAPAELGAVTPATRAPARGKDALIRLATESWVDGVLGEGQAAAAAAREAELAPEPELRRFREVVARDEGQHAELAWDVLRWAVSAGGDDVRHAVHAVREATPLEASSALADDDDLRAHGLLNEASHRAIGAELRDGASRRLDALLT